MLAQAASMDFSNGEDHIEFKSKAHQESTTPRVSASSPAIDIAPPAVRLGSAQQVTVDPPVDDVPAAEAASPFAFDDAGFSARFLSTGESRRVIRCHTNCGQASQVRTPVNNIEYFPPNFEGLVLGCIDADFCK